MADIQSNFQIGETWQFVLPIVVVTGEILGNISSQDFLMIRDESGDVMVNPQHIMLARKQEKIK